MQLKGFAREDMYALLVKLVDGIKDRFPLIQLSDTDEDILFEQVETVLDDFFEQPDYRNYN